MGTIFVCRHASVGRTHELSAYGEDEVARLRTVLESQSFMARASVSSTEVRCVQTARHLTYEQEPVQLPALHAYGTFEMLKIVGPEEEWQEPRDYAYARLAEVDEHLRTHEKLVLCAHDSIPVMIAYALVERAGGEVNWNEREIPIPLRVLHMGHGLLVNDRDLSYVQPGG